MAARNADALLRIVDPEIRVSFGSSSGIEAFKDYHLSDREVDFWAEFDFILRHGGRLRTVDAFDAPYPFSDWPAEFDPFECLAVTGSRVRLRVEPSFTATTLTLISYAIVERLDYEPSADWWRVRLADGRSGYMASRYLRSPVDYRALFEFKNGRWLLVAYIAGD